MSITLDSVTARRLNTFALNLYSGELKLNLITLLINVYFNLFIP